MKNVVSVAEFKTAEGHCHPAFNVGRQEYEGVILDDLFEVGNKEFEDEIEVGFGREYVKELLLEVGNGMVYLYDVLVVKFTQKFDFANSRHVEAVLIQSYFNLFDSDLSACCCFMS